MVLEMRYIFPFNYVYYLYKITNLLNNKVYIGRTKNPRYRYRQHNYCIEHISDSNLTHQKIHREISSVGSEHFVFEVFEKCNSFGESCDRELYWIKFYNSENDGYGYNEKGRAFDSISLSNEHKRRMSLKMSGKGNPMFGKKQSPETLRKMSIMFSGENNPFFGRTHSEESKKKIGLSSKGRCAGENNAHSKLTVQKVKEIREKWKTGNYTKISLSKEYDVSAVTIGDIISRKTWSTI